MAAPRRNTSEWTLWVVAASCALHVAEEYLTGWQNWAAETLGIAIPAARFFFANALLVAAALLFARVGWRRPVLSLLIPSATLANAVLFHIVPSLIQGRMVPGIYTALFLYVPFSSWALVGAARDGLPRVSIAAAFAAGTCMMLSVVFAARLLSVERSPASNSTYEFTPVASIPPSITMQWPMI